VVFLVGLAAMAGAFAFGATEAHAQVFKPRSGSRAALPAKTAAAAPAPATSTAGNATAKKAPATATPAAATSKKPTRATGPTPRRVGTTAPAKKSRGAAKGQAASEDPVVIDDDEDDVKITDD
jgi:hypothetical protein